MTPFCSPVAWERHEPAAATLQISDLREFAAVASGAKPPEYSAAHDLTVQEWLFRSIA
jgi:hypothetical protein